MIYLTNGHIQTANNVPITPNGYIELYLNIDAQVIAAPYGVVLGGNTNAVRFYFDSNGDLVTPAQVWSNLELNPQSSNGLGTWYIVNFYDSNGTRLNNAPQNWMFNVAAGNSVDIGTMTPINAATIYYPALPAAVSVYSTNSASINNTTLMTTTLQQPMTVSVYLYQSGAGANGTVAATACVTIEWVDPSGINYWTTSQLSMLNSIGANSLSATKAIFCVAGTTVSYSVAYTSGSGFTTQPSYGVSIRLEQ
jgi:hypothetical protein